jgi:uncharacterized membrane protein YczE
MKNKRRSIKSEKILLRITKKGTLFIGGLFCIAIGVNLSKIGGLGISPVASIPYAMELVWGVELGFATIIIYMAMIALQMLLLRRRYKFMQLLQLVCTYLFGFLVTLTGTNMLGSFLPSPRSYPFSMIYCFIGVIFIGIGVSLYLVPDWIPMPAEGLALAIADISKGRIKFHQCKILLDVIWVTISAVLSLLFLGGLVTIREGTVIDATCAGLIVGFMHKHFKDSLITWINNNGISVKSDT